MFSMPVIQLAVFAAALVVAMARTRGLAFAGNDLPSRGTIPVQRSGAGHVLAVNEVSGTAVIRLQAGRTRPCTIALTSLSRITAVVAAVAPADDDPLCDICGLVIGPDQELVGCSNGREHAECHYEATETGTHGHDDDVDARPTADEVDPRYEMAVQLGRLTEYIRQMGVALDAGDGRELARLVRAAVEASR